MSWDTYTCLVMMVIHDLRVILFTYTCSELCQAHLGTPYTGMYSPYLLTLEKFYFGDYIDMSFIGPSNYIHVYYV